MNAVVLIVVAAAAVYLATNIDDLLVLLAFFADDAYSDSEIFVGQYFGIGLLVAISLLEPVSRSRHVCPARCADRDRGR